MMMISLLVIIKNFPGGGIAPSADPSPGGDSRTLNKDVRIPEKCIKMCHFKIKSSKIYLGGGGSTSLPDSTPSAPLAFASYSYTYILLYRTCSRTLK